MVDAVAGERQLEQGAGEAGALVDQREQAARGDIETAERPAQKADRFAHQPMILGASSVASMASTAPASPWVLISQVPMSSSLVRIERMASSSSRASARGYQARACRLDAGDVVGLCAGRAIDGKHRGALRPVDRRR